MLNYDWLRFFAEHSPAFAGSPDDDMAVGLAWKHLQINNNNEQNDN